MRNFGLLFMFSLMVGCVAETAPYLREQTMFRDPLKEIDWFGDGNYMIITLYNPLPYAVEATFTCITQGNENGVERKTATVPAHSETRYRGQIMQRDMHTGACFVMSWDKAENTTYVELPKVINHPEDKIIQKMLATGAAGKFRAGP